MQRKTSATPYCISLFLLFSVAASAAPAHNYPIAGKVLDAYVGPDRAHIYKLETETSIYKLLCYRHLFLGAIPAECRSNGNPLQTGDQVHLRSDGETIFLDAGNGQEQTLSILLEEAKTLPPLPRPASATEEGAVVLAHGLELTEVDFPQSSIRTPPPAPASAPAMPTGPVLAVPVTGGSPVPVTASGPVTGGIVNGVSATGQPVTAIAVGPVSSPSPSAPPPNPAPAPSGPQLRWISVLYLQTENHIYKIQCASISCISAARKLDLGDPLMAKIEGPWVYVSSVPGPASANSKTKESKWRILSVTDADDPPSSQPL